MGLDAGARPPANAPTGCAIASLITRIWSPTSWISSSVLSMFSIFISCSAAGRRAVVGRPARCRPRGRPLRLRPPARRTPAAPRHAAAGLPAPPGSPWAGKSRTAAGGGNACAAHLHRALLRAGCLLHGAERAQRHLLVLQHAALLHEPAHERVDLLQLLL
jgi:hypothetical protein